VLFDLLWADGHSLMDRPYEERRAALLDLGLTGASWQTPPHEVGDGGATLEVSKRFGLEGVVGKRIDSRYEQGKRSGAWVKVKNVMRQEFVVGGWQPGEGGRTGSIGSLLLGYYDDDGKLAYAGKAGSGLSGASITELTQLFERCARDTNPFEAGPKVPKGVHFVDPVLVVEVKFTEWTSAGNIRQPTFLGTRPDKDPHDVVREIPV
jgi:bifunctional non-homologous end joining protein LigD